MRLFVANVGVNETDAQVRGLKSPIFPDGTFELVPIKERSDLAGRPEILRYRDLKCWNSESRSIADFLPERIRQYAAHADPEFETFTYGDILSSRAGNLKDLEKGDLLWFLARLWNHNGQQWSGGSDFYFIGFFNVDQNLLIDSAGVLTAELKKRVKRNAHYKRLLSGEKTPFRIILGDPLQSRRFHQALRVTPEVVGLLYSGIYDPVSKTFRNKNGQTLLNKNGRPRRLETFGSVTRAIQMFLDSTSSNDSEHLEGLLSLSDQCGRSEAKPEFVCQDSESRRVPAQEASRLFELLADQVIGLIRGVDIQRTRDVIQINTPEDEGITLLFTPDHVELRLPTIEWTSGTHGPVKSSRLWKRARLEGLTLESLRILIASAHKARRREFHECRYCGKSVPAEHLFSKNVCHTCAQQHEGVVF